MVKLATTALRSALSDTLNRVNFQGERVLLERNGKAVAALVSAEDLELIELLEDQMDIAAAREAMKEPGSIPWRDLKKTLGI